MDAITATSSRPYLGFANAKLYFWMLLLVTGNIVLPSLFHRFGLAGPVFLPIYFFSLVGGLLYGWRCGLIVGIVSPLISFTLSGMPVLAILPSVVMKSTLLGLLSGVLEERQFSKNVFLVAAIAIVATQAIAFALLSLSSQPSALALADVRVGYPGLLLQLTAAPLIVRSLRRHEDDKLPHHRPEA